MAVAGLDAVAPECQRSTFETKHGRGRTMLCDISMPMRRYDVENLAISKDIDKKFYSKFDSSIWRCLCSAVDKYADVMKSR